jgi:hypothetical protein
MKLSISDFLNPVTSCLGSKCIPQPSVLKHLQTVSLLVVLPPKAHTPFRQLLLDIQHALIHLRDTNSQNGASIYLRSSKWVSRVRLYYRLVTTYSWNILFKNVCNLKQWSSARVLTSSLTEWLMVNRLQYFSRSMNSMYVWSAKYVNCK